MRMREAIQTMVKRAGSSARHIISFLLLTLVTFLVVNPIWECHDHLDNLRHLGPHGLLIILLTVAVAAIPLLKAACWLLIRFLDLVSMLMESVAVVRPISCGFAWAPLLDSGPPLRI
jgi:hypothetical protein